MNKAGETILRLRRQNKILTDCMERVKNSIALVAGALACPAILRRAFQAVVEELEKGVANANKL